MRCCFGLPAKSDVSGLAGLRRGIGVITSASGMSFYPELLTGTFPSATPRVPAAARNSFGAGARKPPKIHIFVVLYIDTMMMLVLVVLIHLLIKGC